MCEHDRSAVETHQGSRGERSALIPRNAADAVATTRGVKSNRIEFNDRTGEKKLRRTLDQFGSVAKMQIVTGHIVR
jgi:hypothetical protein